MPLYINTTNHVSGDQMLPGLSKTNRGKLMTIVGSELVRMWHTRFRPKHFTRQAFREYGYAPRSRRYEEAKFRHHKHRLPLVLTGKSRELSKSATIRASKNRASVAMPVRVFNYSAGKRIDLVDEFRRTSAREIRIYDREATKILNKALKGNLHIRVDL